MTYLQAYTIQQTFKTAFEFGDYGERKRSEVVEEVAKKYTIETLTEAYAVLNKHLDEERDVLFAIFGLAVKSKQQGAK